MRAVDIIRKKRDGLPLSAEEIGAFVSGVTSHPSSSRDVPPQAGAPRTTSLGWPEYQLSALLMAIVLRGMTAEETALLTDAMVHSGARLDWSDLPGRAIDKHSTGGVGDKTSLILVPLAAACGVLVPKMSGRGLGHTGGTLDKLESIPGFRVDLTLRDLRAALERVGCALMGQTKEIAPADKILYGLRDVTATVESIPLICASIMSKKIAEGIEGLVLDVKCGAGAFMKELDHARALARSLVANGIRHGVRTRALLTRMDVALGWAVGNALEVRECLDTLHGRGPADLEHLAVQLATHMVQLAGDDLSLADAEIRVRDALTSGRGLEKFRDILVEQGGDPSIVDDPGRLSLAPEQMVIRAQRPGYAHGFDALAVGQAAMVLGAGRERVEDTVDHGVGVRLLVKPEEQVKENQPIVELYHRNDGRLPRALALLEGACPIEDHPQPETPLILETLTGEGEG